MQSPTSMQDQIKNRIEDLMNDHSTFDWDELFQNIATLSLVIFFMSFGLSW